MSDEPGGWIAFEVLSGITSEEDSTGFWLDAKNLTAGILNSNFSWPYTLENLYYPADGIPTDGQGNPTPELPQDKHFSQFSAMQTKVERDYAGINSSGGPQVAGRADHDEIQITRSADVLSPILYQFVSTGEAFRRVFIVLRDADGNPRVEWLLTNVNLTEYSFTGEHYFSSSLEYSPNSELGTATTIESSAPRKWRRRETFRLLYTTAQMRVGVCDSTQTPNMWHISDFRGWDTGTNERITDYPTNPNP